MDWSDAAWIGPTAVALASLGVQALDGWNTRAKEATRLEAERDAFVADRRLDLTRESFLSLMNVSGTLLVTAQTNVTGLLPPDGNAVNAYRAFRDAIHDSGGYIDAYGSDASREALSKVRGVLTMSSALEAHLAHLDECSAEVDAAGDDFELAAAQGRVRSAISSTALQLTMDSEQWTGKLPTLIDALRADLHRSL